MEKQFDELIKKAFEARKFAYAPYSNFYVGAAIQTRNGKIFTGCNIESAAYGLTNCAERTAIFKAVSEGYKDFTAIVICGGKSDDSFMDYCYPCGACRQVINEFVKGEVFDVIVAKSETEYVIHKFSELFPHGFGPKNLE